MDRYAASFPGSAAMGPERESWTRSTHARHPAAAAATALAAAIANAAM
jgi:hypothetical protein